MVKLTEEMEAVEIKTDNRDELFTGRHQNRPRRHSRPVRVKKNTWKRGIHQRRNKRFTW